MTTPQTHTEIIEHLRQIKEAVGETIQHMPPERFDQGSAAAWSAAGYIKHLILSIKPLAKALGLPPAQMLAMFGTPYRPSRTFAEITALYDTRLSEGVRAETFGSNITPDSYRMPDGVEDVQAYLLATWHDSNQRLLDTLAAWAEDDLDRYQLPHPALEMLTLREMLFFTLHHNTMHWRDIEQAGRSTAAI